MRASMRHFWTYVPLSSKLSLFWERVTLSRITTIYFIFSVLHFSVQLGLQIQAFIINAQAASFLGELVQQGNASQAGFTVYDSGNLHMCDTAPSSTDTGSCVVIWSINGAGNSTSDISMQAVANMSSVIASLSSSASSYSISLSASVTGASPSLVVASSLSSVAVSTASASTSIPPSDVVSSSALLSASGVSSRSVIQTTSAASALHASVASAVSHTSTPSAIPTPAGNVQVHDLSSTATSTHTVTVTKEVTVSQTANPTDMTGNGDAALANISTGSHNVKRGSPNVQAINNGSQTEVQVKGLPDTGPVTLDHTCLSVLNWPTLQLDFTKREDIAFIMFQFWLLAMSLVALLNESIPHIIASLLMHVGATAWGGFQIFDTSRFHDDFTQLTTSGACGVNLLPTYWQERSNAEIPSLALNSAALLVSAFLSWRLIKLFGWQTFKRVGASRTINRIYNVVLVLSISIQLALFFIAVAASLWLDQLINGVIATMTTHRTLFEVLIIVVLVILIPWLTMGWIAVRREHTIAMLAFLVVAFLYLAGWGAMFAVATFRWTFTQWRFFSIMASASVVLALVTFLLGIVCRVNFGKGLQRYLNAQEPLPEDDFLPTVVEYKVPEDVEKVAFPSHELPIPTYNNISFGPEPRIAPISPGPFAPRRLGPRFYNQSSEPFEPQPRSPLQAARGYVSAMSSQTVISDAQSLKRSESNASDTSGYSHQSKRQWVIE